MFRHALTAAALLAAFLAHAKTPGEVYEQAAQSTVVVQNIDSNGRIKGTGSGVVLPDRDVVTNCHVVKTQAGSRCASPARADIVSDPEVSPRIKLPPRD